MSDKPPAVIVQHPRSAIDTVTRMQWDDARRALNIAEQIADAHEADYLGRQGRFIDIASLPDEAQRSWYRALGAYALRSCRRAWRTYAYQQARDHALYVVQDVLSHAFLEPSRTDPGVLVKMPPEKVKAMVGTLTTEILRVHQAVLNGDVPVGPGTYLELEQKDRVQL